MSTKYLIITRYNVDLYKKFDAFSQKKDIGLTLEGYWQRRLEICRDFTYRSLKRQTDQDFKWILWIDKDTPDKHIDDLRESFGDIAELRPGVSKNKFIPGRCIVTKMDNDDILDDTFIEETRKRALQHTQRLIIEPKACIKIDIDLSQLKFTKTPPQMRIVNSEFVTSIYTFVGEQYPCIIPHTRGGAAVDYVVPSESYAACMVHGSNRCHNTKHMSPITDDIKDLLAERFGLTC